MIKKSIIGILVLVLICIYMCGCESDTIPVSDVDKEQTKSQEDNQKDMMEKVDDPKIIFWTEKNMASWLYELRDDPKLKCYYYTRCDMTGKYIYEGTCIGYGIPYSAQYSNPEKYGQVDGGEYGAINPYTMPQAEPNGMFMPESSSATWVIKTDPNNPKEFYAEYQESLITVTKYKKPRNLCEEWSLPTNY